MGALELLLGNNQRAARPAGADGRAKICVVACDDAALTSRLELALGIGPGEAVVIRVPGAGTGLPIGVLQRAVAKAVYLEECDEVVLLGHASCTLSSLTADKVLAALSTWGVPRAAVPFDVRDLVGGDRDPKAGLRQVADALRRTEFLPRDVLIHVCHLDESWTVEVIEHGQTAQVARTEDSSGHLAGYAEGPATMPEPSIASTEVPVVQIPDAQPISVALPSQTVKLSEVKPLSFEPTKPVAPSAPRPAPPQHRAPPPPLPQGRRQRSPPPPPRRTSSGERNQVVQAQGRRGESAALKPELVEAIDRLRNFMIAEIDKSERRLLAEELRRAQEAGIAGEELAKILLKPVLALGTTRYKVIDEMIAVKEALVGMPPAQAHTVARTISG